MNKKVILTTIAITLIIVTVLGALTYVVLYFFKEDGHFQDAQLERCVEEHLLKDNLDSFKEIEVLNCEDRRIEIAYLGGIEKLKNLKELNLADNNIINLEPLRSLSNLTHLNLSDNKITDFDVLEDLSNLEFLDISNYRSGEIYANEISSISPIIKLEKLEDLRMSNLDISDIEGIENLVHLETLHINGNEEIDDLTFLEDLENLTTLNARILVSLIWIF